MAYDDPRNLRDHAIKIRVNDDEYAFLKAWANLSRKQLAVLARERMLAGMKLLMDEQEQQAQLDAKQSA